MTSKKRRHVSSSSSSSSSASNSSKELKEEMTRMKEERKQMKEEMKEERKQMKEEMKIMKEEMTMMKEEMTLMKEERTQIRLSDEGFQRKVTEQFNELKDAILLLRPSPTSSKEGNNRNLKLQCKTNLAQRVYTGSKLAGDQGTGIQIILMDADTNQIVTTGIESSIKVHAVVLEGDFNRKDHENWTREEFDGYIVKERPQKRPLLIGELHVTLKEGAGSLTDLTFTDNSSWNRSRMFRIGVRVASEYCEGSRIREALTDPFSVLEHRGESYMKHHPPQSSDYVWRLEGIGKDGPCHKRLKEEGINNVEEFLQAYNKYRQELRNILGNCMTSKKWNSLIEHAKTCRPSGKFFVFYPNAKRNYGLLFDNFACLAGRLLNGVPQIINSVSNSEKREMEDLVKIAHQNWKDVIEYTGFHGLDPDIERSIIPHPAATALFEIHYGSAAGPSQPILEINNTFGLQGPPIQTSPPDHPDSALPSAGLASLHMGNAGSSVVSKQTSTSQQIVVQAGETTTSHQLVQSTSSSSELFDVDELLADDFLGGSFLRFFENNVKF